jgi:hypothetical protein
MDVQYTLRQKADYDLDPDPFWHGHLQDAEGAAVIARNALELARMLPRLDFSPVASLFDPRG